MSFNHEAVAALPVASNADKALMRAMATRRFEYALDVSESAANFTAVDPDSGVIPLYVKQNNISFLFDSTDTTTAADGVTCLVTNDGKRYKAASVAPPYSVLTRQTVTEPDPVFDPPAVGDTYLIPTAATGPDWAGKDGQIGIFTARGWVFATSPIGRFLYVKDETAFYHRAASGTWTAGVGSIALGANSVNITNVLGANASYVVRVENQTTNAPPASPTAPTAYIIGPSPTGSWSGNAGRLAICLVAGTFTIITPLAGDTVYDKALANSYRFDGTTWLSSAGAWVRSSSVSTQSGSTTIAGTANTPYLYSSSTAPTTANRFFQDQTVLAYTAKVSGARLRFDYICDASFGKVTIASWPTNALGAIALFRDSEIVAVAWQKLSAPVCELFVAGAGLSAVNTSLIGSFEIAASDALAHTYYIGITTGSYATTGSTAVDCNSLTRRVLAVQEASS